MKVVKQLFLHEGFKRYFSNTSWMIFEKVIRIIVSIFVTTMIARYLGPSDFGVLSYALSVVALLAAFVNLGMDEILVRDLVNQQSDYIKIIPTAFKLRLFGSLCGFVIISIFSYFTSNFWINFIIGGSIIFQSFGVIEIYLQSQVKMREAMTLSLINLVVFSSLKLLLVFLKTELYYFAWVFLLEVVALSVGHYFLLKKNHIRVFSFPIDISMVRRLVNESWPLAVGGLVVSAYMRIDQIMISHLNSISEVGIYAAALRISESWYFVPVLVSASLFPAIIKGKSLSVEKYQQRLEGLFSFVTVTALCFAVPVSFLADLIVSLLFGSEYQAASDVLVLHVWAAVFVGFGVVSAKWYVVEGLQKLLLARSIFGLVTNVAINYFLIPKMGASGAAIATLISQAFVTFFFDLTNKRTRSLFVIKLKSLLLMNIKSLIPKSV